MLSILYFYSYIFFLPFIFYDSKLMIFRMRTFCIAFNILVLSLTSFIATIVLRSIIVFLLPLKLLRFFHKTFSQILDIFHRLKPYTHTLAHSFKYYIITLYSLICVFRISLSLFLFLSFILSFTLIDFNCSQFM